METSPDRRKKKEKGRKKGVDAGRKKEKEEKKGRGKGTDHERCVHGARVNYDLSVFYAFTREPIASFIGEGGERTLRPFLYDLTKLSHYFDPLRRIRATTSCLAEGKGRKGRREKKRSEKRRKEKERGKKE